MQRKYTKQNSHTLLLLSQPLLTLRKNTTITENIPDPEIFLISHVLTEKKQIKELCISLPQYNIQRKSH